MNDLGTKIRKIRIDHNLTQQEFGQLFNVSTQAVSKWETKIKFSLIIKFVYLLIFIPIILILAALLIIIFYQPNNFEFKTISSNCQNFNISGSIAYNNDKSSIYISQIDYCGEKDDNIYQNITCTLYEENGSIKAKIDTCKSKENITLENYLKDITFHIDNYQKTCKNYQENSLQIEIKATDEQGNIRVYNVPLSLEDNCRME